MSSKRVKVMLFASWCPNLVFLVAEGAALVIPSSPARVEYCEVRARCVTRGLEILDVTRFTICRVMVTTIVTLFYISMWIKICSRDCQNTTFQRKLAMKHKKFAAISGIVILTGALSWVPKSVLIFSRLYTANFTAYYAALGLHYLVTVTNPIIYILGTQRNVIHALFRTPVEYRRRMSVNTSWSGAMATRRRNCIVSGTTGVILPELCSMYRPGLLENSKPPVRQRRNGVVEPPRIARNIRSASTMELDFISESESE